MNDHERIASVLAQAWEQKDFELLRSSLEDELEWREGPYSTPLKTPDEVIRTWVKDLEPQNNIKVTVDGIAADGNEVYYHFRASWDDSKRGKVEIDGVFCVTISDAGKITKFDQWYEIKA